MKRRRTTEEDVARGYLRVDIGFTSMLDSAVTDITRQIREGIDRKLAVALVEFYNTERRWPAWAWVEDWHRPSHPIPLDSPISIPIPDVSVGDVLPDERVRAAYESDALNHDENLAADVLHTIAALGI